MCNNDNDMLNLQCLTYYLTMLFDVFIAENTFRVNLSIIIKLKVKNIICVSLVDF